MGGGYFPSNVAVSTRKTGISYPPSLTPLPVPQHSVLYQPVAGLTFKNPSLSFLSFESVRITNQLDGASFTSTFLLPNPKNGGAGFCFMDLKHKSFLGPTAVGMVH